LLVVVVAVLPASLVPVAAALPWGDDVGCYERNGGSALRHKDILNQNEHTESKCNWCNFCKSNRPYAIYSTNMLREHR
jgi:hypothetical protein